MCHAVRRSRRALASIAVALLVGATGADARSVHIRGTAYEFNSAGVVINGATIRVAEHPRSARDHETRRRL
jgi:hypothetical protein